MVMNESGAVSSNITENTSTPPPSPETTIEQQNPDISQEISLTGTTTIEPPPIAVISDYRLSEDNPTSMAKFQRKSLPEGWKLPNIIELRSVLSGVIGDSKNLSGGTKEAFVSEDEDIYFISSDFIIYEGIKKFKCLSIQNNKIQDELKEDTELISILFVKN
jgi:hypothetical protein